MSRDFPFRGPSTLTDLRICVSSALLTTGNLDNDITDIKFRQVFCHDRNQLFSLILYYIRVFTYEFKRIP